ncbi:sphingomyelin phosphodiesterase [Shouchella lonarensis]|uniref:sphingomyelin phosphodiesterase n=1 Tax=Shouchella lonarensis TaxID=1464122 RepID=UPI000B881B82
MKGGDCVRRVIKLLVCVFILSVFSSVSAAQERIYPEDFKILTHNVYFLPRSLFPNWGQLERADLIADAHYMDGHDVIIFSELFDNGASNRLLNNISNQYSDQTPVLGRGRSGWDDTRGSYSSLTPEDGGVSIVSKWPILEKIQYVYKEACGSDWYANKGFVYVKIEKQGQMYHVIGTHMQSEDEGCATGEARSVRRSQMQEISDFIAEKDIPIEEALWIGGDLNVVKSSSEYTEMLSQLNVTAPREYTGFASTWDPATNGIAQYNYPGGESEHLDYILVEKDHAQPRNWQNQSLYVKSPWWTVTSWFKKYTYNDYSDHYPVAGFSKEF